MVHPYKGFQLYRWGQPPVVVRFVVEIRIMPKISYNFNLIFYYAIRRTHISASE